MGGAAAVASVAADAAPPTPRPLLRDDARSQAQHTFPGLMAYVYSA